VRSEKCKTFRQKTAHHAPLPNCEREFTSKWEYLQTERTLRKMEPADFNHNAQAGGEKQGILRNLYPASSAPGKPGFKSSPVRGFGNALFRDNGRDEGMRCHIECRIIHLDAIWSGLATHPVRDLF